MAARAIWKGIIRFGDIAVPVKLYSAVQDSGVRFRMLHRKDRAPVRQAMVNPESGDVVPSGQIHKAWASAEGELVMLDAEELEALEPEPSRDIVVQHFLPRGSIDPRWYERPYYLGPDGGSEAWSALAAALGEGGVEGLAHWTMRKREYVGALSVHEGYPMLTALRHADELVPASALKPPGGKPLDRRELDMARQLIGMLEAEFSAGDYSDAYRERVLGLIEAKRKGSKVRVLPVRRKRATDDDLGKVLSASIASLKKSA